MTTYSILVVDDEPDNFEVIEALLPGEEYILHYASRGEEAIASLDKFDPDVILLDVMMPGMDGFTTCKRIKANPQWQHVPIIMVTALSGKADLARCLSSGADDFVSKPVNGLELRARVQSMIRIKKQHDRIQSLSKLQRNNIHTLENSLNELRLDLGVSFPKELNAALQEILDNIARLHENVDLMNPLEVNAILDLTQQSGQKLEKLHQDFLFYLQLALNKEAKKHHVCAPKILIEQIVTNYVNRFDRTIKVIFDLADADVAVTPSHLQYIVIELLNRYLHNYQLGKSVNVHGHVIDDNFHFWIDDLGLSPSVNPGSKLSQLIQFNSNNQPEKDWGMGIKIVKKIVEIYDGLFLISTNERNDINIYITLPLATSNSTLSGSLLNV